MKPGARMAVLFIFPVIALLTCAAVSFSLPVKRPYTPERPQFLDYIEKLGVSGESSEKSVGTEMIRNVFSHEALEKKDPALADPPADKPADKPSQPAEKPVAREAGHEPVWVSMIVDDGADSFGVINGQKMKIGEQAEGFTLAAIHKGSVTIRHSDGIEETIHVKAF